MNAKGVLSFVLVLAFLLIYLTLFLGESSAYNEMNSSKKYMIAMEQINARRTIIENNLDFIIVENLKKEFYSGVREPEEIKKAVNLKILNLLENNVAVSEELGTEMQCCKNELKENYNSLSCAGAENLGIDFLEKNSKVIIVKAAEFYSITYIYSAGILKNEIPSCDVCTDDFCTVFAIPAGYEKTVVVAA